MMEHPQKTCPSRDDNDSISLDQTGLFRNSICLAPMVRAGSLPFRTLCLKYGATLVWGEEIIDRRLLRCVRVENSALGTVDFIADSRSLVFRTTAIEKDRVIFQLGTCDPSTALAAAQMVQNDVAGVDINMGCPKKFSIQGGMGAALLKAPAIARELIETLSRNLTIPVTAKIRIIDSVEETIAFMQILEAAGAAAITVHLRQKTASSSDPAEWSLLGQLVGAVNIPVIANGDVYTRHDAEHLMKSSGCSGVMMARPLLLNPSLLLAPPGVCATNGDGQRNDKDHSDIDGSGRNWSGVGASLASEREWKPLRDVICDFLVECVRYEPPYQIVKYTIQEMMSQRRHNQDRLKDLQQAGLSFGRLKDEFPGVAAAKSIAEICKVFSLRYEDLVKELFGGQGEEARGDGEQYAKKRKLVGGDTVAVTPARQEYVSDLRFDDSYFDSEAQLDQAPPHSREQDVPSQPPAALR